MSEYFPKLKLFAGKVKVELDLYNYATKADITVSNLLKKLTIRQKLMELNKKKKKITDHDHSNKDIITQEFNELTAQNFAARLAQTNLASKNDIVALVTKTDFDDKLKHLNKKVTSNKTKHLLVEYELKNYKHLTQVFLLVKVTFSIWSTSLLNI